MVFPVLTPLAYDPGRPFPHISNMSLNLAVTLRDETGHARFARVKVPAHPAAASCPSPCRARQSERPTRLARRYLVWLEQVITAHLHRLFPGMQVVEAHPFRVTRDAEMVIQELEAEDLLETVERGVRERRFGSVVRLTIDPGMPDDSRKILIENLRSGTGRYLYPAPPAGHRAI